MQNWRIYWEFARPFTLLMPAIGMAAGGLVALGANPRFASAWADTATGIVLNVALGALMAAVMNAGSNGLNQIYDIEIDRINKPSRPLPSGRLGLRQAWAFTWCTFAAGLTLAALVNWQCLLMAAAAALLTACYSVPPFRTKRSGILAAVTVAIPRGFLLPVAGWSTVKSIAVAEPWLLSIPLGLFILGAGSTKDFSDVAGDRAGGCKTLPVLFGVRKTALLISPFFVLPFFVWIAMARAGVLSAWRPGIYALSAALAGLGAWIDCIIMRRPEEMSRSENHISWKLIYLMAMMAYAGLALVYVVPWRS